MAPSKQVKSAEATLDELLATVSTGLADMIKKSAKDDAPSESSSGSSGPTKPDLGDGDGDADDAPPASPDASPASASPDAGPPAPEASASAPPADPAADPGMQGPSDPAQLQQAYAELMQTKGIEEVKAHYLAAKAVLVQAMGDAGGSPSPGGPPAASPSPAGPPPMAASPSPAPMQMSEKPAGEAMAKSEARVKELEARLAKTEADTKEVQGSFTKLLDTLTKPIRKSAKGVSDIKFIGRSAGDETNAGDLKPMTRSEVKAALKAKIRSGSLAKTEMDLIVKYDSGSVSFDQIKHLLAPAR